VGKNPKETEGKSKMTDLQRFTALSEAANYADKAAYLSDLALSSMWGDAEDIDSATMNKRLEELGKIYDAATITVSEIRASTGLTQASFSQHYFVPFRTLQDWEGGQRTPPAYVKLFLVQICGLADIF
jgi:DNA-binding transcriptional regulator YiaG